MSNPSLLKSVERIICEQFYGPWDAIQFGDREREKCRTAARTILAVIQPDEVVAYLRRKAEQEPSEGLRERQGIDQRAVEYGQALLRACADKIEARAAIKPLSAHD